MCNQFNKKFIDEAAKQAKNDDSPSDKHARSMQKAISLARTGMDNNEGGPFGCVIVKDGKVIGSGINKVTSLNDPTSHAELNAIKEASRNIDSHDLSGSTLYTSCEPCPMCLGAIYLAKIDKVYYGSSYEDASAAGFGVNYIFDEIAKPNSDRKIRFEQIEQDKALSVFNEWQEKEGKINY